MAPQSVKKSPADRLLDIASELFAREGIRAVGVDRLLVEAGVARASLYSSFGSKDGLVLAYLEHRHVLDQATYQRSASRRTDLFGRILVSFDIAVSASKKNRIFGCAYLNAAAEFADPDHAVNRVVRMHRDWILEEWVAALRAAGVAAARDTGDRVQLLYEGGMAGSQLLRSTESLALARMMAEDLMARARTA